MDSTFGSLDWWLTRIMRGAAVLYAAGALFRWVAPAGPEDQASLALGWAAACAALQSLGVRQHFLRLLCVVGFFAVLAALVVSNLPFDEFRRYFWFRKYDRDIVFGCVILATWTAWAALLFRAPNCREAYGLRMWAAAAATVVVVMAPVAVLSGGHPAMRALEVAVWVVPIAILLTVAVVAVDARAALRVLHTDTGNRSEP